MGRGFTIASSQYYSQGAGFPSISWPFSVACFAYLTDVVDIQTAIDIRPTGGSNSAQRIIMDGSHWKAQQYDGTTGANAVGKAPVLNAWTNLCAIFTGPNSRTFYQDGAFQATDTTSTTLTAASDGSCNIGRSVNGTPFYLQGRLCEFLLYNGTLPASIIKAIASGVHPLRLLAGSWSNVLFYYPFYGIADPANSANESTTGGKTTFEFVGTNSPPAATHAPVQRLLAGAAGFGADYVPPAPPGNLLIGRDFSGIDGRYLSCPMTGGMGA